MHSSPQTPHRTETKSNADGLILNLSHGNLTPNFAMGSGDINIELDAAETRFTAHLFDSSYPCLFPTGPVVQVPNDLTDWPPAVLFDAAYASAVMTNAVVEKDNAKRRVDVQRELHERRDKMAIFDLLINHKYIGMVPEVAARYEEKLQEANAARDREELETKSPVDMCNMRRRCNVVLLLLLLSTTALSMLVQVQLHARCPEPSPIPPSPSTRHARPFRSPAATGQPLAIMHYPPASTAFPQRCPHSSACFAHLTSPAPLAIQKEVIQGEPSGRLHVLGPPT
ncbi:hypothetical protein V8E52_007586 [Russula decolorans]